MKKKMNSLCSGFSGHRKIFRTMKISLVLVLISTLQILAGSSYSQSTRLTLDLKNVTIKEVLSKIEEQCNYYFLYDNRSIDVYKKVDIDVQNEQIDVILKKLFGESEVNAVIRDRHIILAPAAGTTSQQIINVSGKVTDSSGFPLPGVTVVIHGTTQGTITDSNGSYSLSNVSRDATLVFSFVGMRSQEVLVTGKPSIDVIMAEAPIGIEEVVAVGYGTQKKLNLTGSVATLNAEKIQNIPVAGTSNTLVGKIPGLIAVNRDGEPGRDGATMSIRGFGDALIIVDGVEQPFNNIDPNEIENISILKDAAASIYGARAGNGVILITSKRGGSGKPKFSFNYSYALQSPTRKPKLVDAATYATMFNAAEVAVGRNPVYSEGEIEKYRLGTDPNYPNTDWYDEVFREWAPMSQYNLNTSGGGEQVKYFFSLGYLDQEGMLRSGDTRFKRYNLRSNVDAKISNSLSVSVDISGRIEQRDYPESSVAAKYGGKTMSQILEDLYFARPTSPARFSDATKAAYAGIAGVQPLARSDKDFSGYTDANQRFFAGTLNLKYDFPFIKGLSAKASFNYLTDYNYGKNWGKAVTIYNYNRETDEYTFAGSLGKNQLDESFAKADRMTTQLFLNYQKKWNAHDLAAVLVGEFIENKGNSFSAHRENYITTAIDQLFAGGDLNKNNYGTAWEDGRLGYIGRVNYNYAGKYLAEATFRYDASAKFMEGKRWGFFPSVSLGWRLSEEEFLKNNSFINNLKLRASYGEFGYDNVGNYNYLTGYQFAGNYVFGESPQLFNGIASKGLANPDLTWQSMSMSNIGLDASFAKDMLGFEFDYFYRKVTDVPGTRSASLPSTFGANLPQENINSYNDRGFELLVRHRANIDDFNYTLEGNVSWARSKWIHYDEPVYQDEETKNRQQISGQWKNRWFGYEALGLFQSQDEIDNWTVIQDNNDNNTLKPGDIKYADYNNDGVLNWKDEHVIGRGTTPEIIFGLSLAMDYKGFDFSMFWQGAANFNVYFTNEAQNPFYNGAVPYQFLSDYWTEDNKGAKFPRLYPGGTSNNRYVSTYWLQDASYIRLKNTHLGYTFPKQWYSKWNIETFKLYVAAVNLLTIDNVYPFDPETGEGRGWHYPQQRTISVGVNLTF